MGTFTVRAARDEDMKAIGEVHIRARRSYYDGHVPEPELAEWETSVRERGYRLDRFPERIWLCAEQDGEVVGFGLVTPDGKLWQLQVDPPHWGKRIGHELHEACLSRLRALDVPLAKLEVFVHNTRARAFYTSHGWRETSRNDDHVVMEHDL
jgi:ribosomal protein S18 acetylase RimI-like enzyme